MLVIDQVREIFAMDGKNSDSWAVMANRSVSRQNIYIDYTSITYIYLAKNDQL